MKQLKRLTGLFLCIVLAAGCLTGCGGKSDTTILTSSLKTMASAKNFDMSVQMSGKVSMSYEGESEDIEAGAEIKVTQFADPFKSKITATWNAYGVSKTTESYIQKEGDKFVCYVQYAGNEWAKSPMDDVDAASILSYIDSMKKQLTEDVSKYTQKDDIEENGKKYLSYEYTITADSLKNAMERLASSAMESEDEDERKEDEKVIDEIVKVIGDSKITILIDRETEMLYQIRYPAADVIKRMALLDDEDDKEKEEDEKLDVSGMDLIITYTNIGSAADFEVPKEALEAEDLSKAIIDDEIDDEDED